MGALIVSERLVSLRAIGKSFQTELNRLFDGFIDGLFRERAVITRVASPVASQAFFLVQTSDETKEVRGITSQRDGSDSNKFCWELVVVDQKAARFREERYSQDTRMEDLCN